MASYRSALQWILALRLFLSFSFFLFFFFILNKHNANIRHKTDLWEAFFVHCFINNISGRNRHELTDGLTDWLMDQLTYLNWLWLTCIDLIWWSNGKKKPLIDLPCGGLKCIFSVGLIYLSFFVSLFLSLLLTLLLSFFLFLSFSLAGFPLNLISSNNFISEIPFKFYLDLFYKKFQWKKKS